MYPIFAYGTEAQKDHWLPRLARGEAIGCFGLTEPDFGSNPAGMRTRAAARRAGGGLNGAKMWITNGSIADVAVVWARTEDGIRGFLVEKGRPASPRRHEGQVLAARVGHLGAVLQDVEVVDEDACCRREGPEGAARCLTQARYGIAWGALGAAMACYQAALDYAHQRIQFDRPIAAFQLQQEKLAWMVTRDHEGPAPRARLGRLKDENKMTPAQVSMAKSNNVAVALEIAREARDILGANGILGEYPVMRHMANLESVNTYEGTHDIHVLVIGEAVIGISAFRG